MRGFLQDRFKDDNYLTGRFLVAMPGMEDDRFQQTLIYVCAHGPEGAMGLVVNKPLDSISFPDLLSQLDITMPPAGEGIEVLFGGPVETGRGFVLHSPDYMHDATMVVDDEVALTATVDVLRAIAEGGGPRQRLLALGSFAKNSRRSCLPLVAQHVPLRALASQPLPPPPSKLWTGQCWPPPPSPVTQPARARRPD